MKTLKEKIAVMQAALDEKSIQRQYDIDDKWVDIDGRFANWDWNNYDYRIKPKPMDLELKIKTLEEKLERVFEAGLSGIGYVAQANYASREREAQEILEKAMYNEVLDD